MEIRNDVTRSNSGRVLSIEMEAMVICPWIAR